MTIHFVEPPLIMWPHSTYSIQHITKFLRDFCTPHRENIPRNHQTNRFLHFVFVNFQSDAKNYQTRVHFAQRHNCLNCVSKVLILKKYMSIYINVTVPRTHEFHFVGVFDCVIVTSCCLLPVAFFSLSFSHIFIFSFEFVCIYFQWQLIQMPRPMWMC